VVKSHAGRVEVPGAGPLAPHLRGFEAHLRDEGYHDFVLYKKRLLLRGLNRWLIEHHIALADINEARLQQFLADRRRRLSGGPERRRDAPAARQLLRYLRGLGRVPGPTPVVDKSALGKVMQDFERFLKSERGLSLATITGYLRCVRRFLDERFRGRAVCLRHLRAQDLDKFILQGLSGGDGRWVDQCSQQLQAAERGGLCISDTGATELTSMTDARRGRR
jgi:site-specific recombinase XerD